MWVCGMGGSPFLNGCIIAPWSTWVPGWGARGLEQTGGGICGLRCLHVIPNCPFLLRCSTGTWHVVYSRCGFCFLIYEGGCFCDDALPHERPWAKGRDIIGFMSTAGNFQSFINGSLSSLMSTRRPVVASCNMGADCLSDVRWPWYYCSNTH